MPHLRTTLTRHLATLFPDEDSARTMVTLAGIPEGQIDFDGRSLVTWASIVRVTVLCQKMPDLLEVARGEFAEDAVLKEASEALGRDPAALDIAEGIGSSGAPQQVWTMMLVLVGAIIAAAALHLPTWAIITVVAACLIFVLPTLQFLWMKKSGSEPVAPTRKQLADPDKIDLDSGLFGGLAGGIVTGVLLAVVYQRTQPELPLGPLIVQVGLTFGVAVAILGAIVAYLTSTFVRIARKRPQAGRLYNEITASLLAGLLCGPLTGIGLAFHYGQYHGTRRFADPPLLLTGILPGCVVIGVFMAVWNQRPVAPHLMRSIAASVVAAGLVGLPAMSTAALEPMLKEVMYRGGATAALLGGMLYGAILGGICGLVIGIALFLSRHWVKRELTS